ncbi:hypothetical protein SAMN05421670_3003 [Psychrobacillus psychrotolerans]|uniref:Uncharacterized protein n=1 Tax=Psychrobacillus psychrotolerans TaxID=126156 RepID=A0A1I5ZZI6_9BACI|nr:hypothetical protein [Psychrobacillus psychrotolerans]SFQ61832.1 hypothetical protein SAMN05421670_3003 [Psychrobacillus psychrotolerans]
MSGVYTHVIRKTDLQKEIVWVYEQKGQNDLFNIIRLAFPIEVIILLL